MELFPKNFGGKRPDPEIIKQEGWRTLGTLVVNASDPRLSPHERQFVKELGERLYGGNGGKKDKHNDR